MRVAVSILAFFGMIWGLAALSFIGARGALFISPALGAALVLGISLKGLPSNPVTPEQMGHIRRNVRRWSFIEVVAMIASVFLLQHAGAQRHIPAVFAVIVGLHFLPLAIGFPQPIYYATSAFMVVAGLVSLALTSAQLEGVVATSAAAIGLWASAIGTMLFYRRTSSLPV